jgi:hypothetical protein
MENNKKRRARICAAPHRKPGDTQLPAESSEQQPHIPHKLLTRATAINASLLLSLNAVLDAKAAVDSDLQGCKELATELTNCERALAELEALALANRPKDRVQDIADESSPVTDEESDENKLLQTITLQKEQIGALESRLNNLLQDRLPSAQTSAEKSSAEKPAAAQVSAHSNRVLIAIDRSGNLKFPICQSVLTIGRQPSNDIHIKSRYLSRLHARIISDAKGAFIEDLDSANGVIVNSRQVRRCLLRSGDRITLGRTHLQYIDIDEDTEDAGQA